MWNALWEKTEIQEAEIKTEGVKRINMEVKRKHKFSRAVRLFATAFVLLVAVATMFSPNFALAQAPSYPDINGHYFKANTALSVYNMDGSLAATYRRIGMHITSQTDSVVTGHLDIYQASSVSGTTIASGTGSIQAIRLVEGENHIVVFTAGIHQLHLPDGVQAVATTDSATVTGSPATLTASGAITTSTTGIFHLTVSLKVTTVATFTGVVGTGARARIQLVGTQPYASVEDHGGTGTVDGEPVKVVPASSTVNVSSAGTFHVDMPYGMYGTATSGSATIVGSPVTLTPGTSTTLDTSATTGTVTIALQYGTGFNLSGYLKFNHAGTSVTGMTARVDGFIVLDNDPWTVLCANRSFRATME